ncbi:hypothetical protein MNBD_GAMMA12-3783 [hydrothermal vent metagenome]|uniref:Uncharacterized protein n=1 Tax=hydrothermal vent metagenome TaxID=652676 RepID=A0A3B0YG03_9ZZZZ
MISVNFIDDIDKSTYFPFELIDARKTKCKDVRLSFNDWDWFSETYNTDIINDYYMNGYGVQGLVLAARVAEGLEAYSDEMEPNSEGDTCYIMFSDLETAVETAEIASKMIKDRQIIERIIIVARENDLED